MTPLDLRAAPPRSPYDELAGMVMLARTVDKARGLLPGGDPGIYWISPGMSEWLIGKLGYDQAAFIALAGDATDDAAVAQLVEERNSPERLARLDVSDDLRGLQAA